MIQRSAIFKVVCTAIAWTAYMAVWANFEAKRVENIQIRPINLESTNDGSHKGGFVYLLLIN